MIAFLKEIWEETKGSSSIKVAIIDGSVDASHPALQNANLQFIDNNWGKESNKDDAALQHGTHIASIIFGQHEHEVKGITPDCKGLILPIFRSEGNGNVLPCSQLDLARTIIQAVDAGAHIINISGGELSESGAAHPILQDAIKYAEKQNVLIIAAAGNDGCACLHIPGALPWVLPVGAMDKNGDPLGFSNWGKLYGDTGILAPGENIPGAQAGGGIAYKTGTSYAAAIVSGVAALLLSIQIKNKEKPNPKFIRAALLSSAVGCQENDHEAVCQRLLKGKLNLKGAYSIIHQKQHNMTETPHVLENAQTTTEKMNYHEPAAINLSGMKEEQNGLKEQEMVTMTNMNPMDSKTGIQPSDCGCGGEGKNAKQAPQRAQMVFALGTLGYDFVSEARRDSLMQHANGVNLQDPAQLLSYLEKNPWDAASMIWTLNMDVTPIYAIHPAGPFANEGYARLREFLNDQVKEGAERISVPGIIAGNVQLMSGQIVPAIIPDLRCMYNWSIAQLLETVLGKAPANNTPKEEKEAYAQRQMAILNFLERVYHELRNLGMTPQERAINYAATNALNAAGIFAEAIKDTMQLDSIETEPSPICRPGAECWDVKLIFFDPEKQFQRARKAYRFTIDVSEPCPVMVGGVKTWYIR